MVSVRRTLDAPLWARRRFCLAFFLTFARSAYYGGRSIPFEALCSRLQFSLRCKCDRVRRRRRRTKGPVCGEGGVRVALICRATNAKLLRVKGPEKWLWPRTVVQQRFPVKILKSNSSSGQVYVLCRKLGFARGIM